jgi:hypothetical protein
MLKKNLIITINLLLFLNEQKHFFFGYYHGSFQQFFLYVCTFGLQKYIIEYLNYITYIFSFASG